MKKNIFTNLSIIAGLIILLLLSSCTNSYEQMINNFNENYFTLTPTPPKENSLLDFEKLIQSIIPPVYIVNLI